MAWPGDRLLLIVRPPACRYVSIRLAQGVSAMPQSAPLGNEKRAVVWPQGSAFAPWISLRPRPSRA